MTKIHQAAIERACNSAVALGVGSGLLITVRDLPRREVASSGSPANGLSLIGPTGTTLYDVGLLAPVDTSGHRQSSQPFSARNSGHLSASADLPRRDGPGANLSPVKVEFHPVLLGAPGAGATGPARCGLEPGVDRTPAGSGRRSCAKRRAVTTGAKAARDALVNNRQVTAAAATAALMERKFRGSDVGLARSSSLLEAPRHARRLWISGVILQNLIELIGSDHPDVQAIALATSNAPAPTAVTTDADAACKAWDAGRDLALSHSSRACTRPIPRLRRSRRASFRAHHGLCGKRPMLPKLAALTRSLRSYAATFKGELFCHFLVHCKRTCRLRYSVPHLHSTRKIARNWPAAWGYLASSLMQWCPNLASNRRGARDFSLHGHGWSLSVQRWRVVPAAPLSSNLGAAAIATICRRKGVRRIAFRFNKTERFWVSVTAQRDMTVFGRYWRMVASWRMTFSPIRWKAPSCIGWHASSARKARESGERTSRPSMRRDGSTASPFPSVIASRSNFVQSLQRTLTRDSLRPLPARRNLLFTVVGDFHDAAHMSVGRQTLHGFTEPHLHLSKRHH